MTADTLAAGGRQEKADGSPAELWQDVLQCLQKQVTRPIFDTWLKDTVGLRLEGEASGPGSHRLVVGARSDFAIEWLSTKLRTSISRIVTSLSGKIAEVGFEVLGAPAGSARGPGAESAGVSALEPSPPPPTSRAGQAAHVGGAGAVWPRPRLNPRFTFDSFVVGSSNRLVHGAAMAVASSPASVYNPLVIIGASGLGKTHLLHAIAHEALRAGTCVAYATAERFTSDYTNASRERRWDEFRWRYRGADMLLIDDLQFLEGKGQTMRELAHTIEELHSSCRQVVIAADRCPCDIPGLAHLASRLQAGLNVSLEPPTLQLRISILHAKSGNLGLRIPREVMELLASHPSVRDGNVRKLEASLQQVAVQARTSGLPVTLDVAARSFHDVEPDAPAAPTPEAVVTAVCDHFELSRQLLTGRSRASHVALARQIAMYLLREESRCTLAQIGRLLGDRDHSTALHGSSKIARELGVLADTRQHVRSIQRRLHQSVA